MLSGDSARQGISYPQSSMQADKARCSSTLTFLADPLMITHALLR